MPYITGRVVHDADAHIMEEPTWLIDHADPDLRERLEPNVSQALSPDEDVDVIEHFRERHADPEFRAHDAEEIMARKNFKAPGSFIREDPPRPEERRVGKKCVRTWRARGAPTT